jgi:hypothetical protein
MTNSIAFPILVNVPTILLMFMIFVGNIPGEWARRALVTYAALLTVLFGALLGTELDSQLVVYGCVVASFAAAALSGPWGLLLAALAAAAIAAANLALLPGPSALGPSVVAASAIVAFAHSRLIDRF